MSTPTMNHNSHTQQQQQQQQQRIHINEMQHGHLNATNSSPMTLTRSDSTSTVILEEEDPRTCRPNGPTTTHPPSLRAKFSTQLRSLLKTSGLFNGDLESSDKLNEIFESGNTFALQRLLSEANVNDISFDINELFKLDSNKQFDTRTLSEFLRSESFDQLLASTTNDNANLANPPAQTRSISSFSELRPVSPEFTNGDMFENPSNNQLFHTIDLPTSSKMHSNQGALNAIEHDHAFLTKRNPVDNNNDDDDDDDNDNDDDDVPSSSTTSKRTPRRGSRRTSSRIQSRAVRNNLSDENPANKSKRSRQTTRAADVKSVDDLNYYLERRRRNNEASKQSRAARKQKFGNMDQQCKEYERVNAELRVKISTLEKVTISLKSGLVNNFQRKS